MKQFACGDVVPGCSAVMRGETEAEVMAAVAAHAKKDHGMQDVPPALAAKVQSMIRDSPVTQA